MCLELYSHMLLIAVTAYVTHTNTQCTCDSQHFKVTGMSIIIMIIILTTFVGVFIATPTVILLLSLTINVIILVVYCYRRYTNNSKAYIM